MVGAFGRNRSFGAGSINHPSRDSTVNLLFAFVRRAVRATSAPRRRGGHCCRVIVRSIGGLTRRQAIAEPRVLATCRKQKDRASPAHRRVAARSDWHGPTFSSRRPWSVGTDQPAAPAQEQPCLLRLRNGVMIETTMIELVSVHIPKTAGTSFGAILQRLYADRLYRPDPALEWEEMARRTPAETRAVHGHLMARDFLRSHPHSEVVVSMRHPVDWTISYYNFWLATPSDGNPHHDLLLQQRFSVVEFAQRRLMEPLPSEYLTDVSLERVGFKGHMADFDTDTTRFLGWLEAHFDPDSFGVRLGKALLSRVPHLNRTLPQRETDAAQRDALRIILADEIAFYDEALRIRMQRIHAMC